MTLFRNNTREIEENGVLTIVYPNGSRDIRQNGITTHYNRAGRPLTRTRPDGSLENLEEGPVLEVTGQR